MHSKHYKHGKLSAEELLAILSLVGLLVVMYMLYRPSFAAPFYFDSKYHLLEKTNLHLTSLTLENLNQAIRLDGGRIYRPISYLSLAFTYYFWGNVPAAYRVGNLLIHWGGALSLFFFILAVFRTPKTARAHPELVQTAIPVALFATALWALHPIQTNVVPYVIQRMASLAGLFSFLSAGAYLRARCAENGWSHGWGGLFLISFLLALGSKENPVTLLPVLAGAEWLLLDPADSPAVRRAVRIFWFCLALGGLVLIAWKGPAFWELVQTGYAKRPFDLGERLFTQLRLQARYLLILLVPDPRLLRLDADVPLSHGLFDPPRTAAAAIMVVLALALALYTRKTKPLIGFGIFWFFGTQLLESTVLPLELYFEHRMYIPSAMVFVSIAWAGCWVVRRLRLSPVLVMLLIAFSLAGESWATHTRNDVWTHPLKLMGDSLIKSPGKMRTYVNVANTLARMGEVGQAAALLDDARKRNDNPTWAPAITYNLALVRGLQGDVEGRNRLLLETIEYGTEDPGGAEWVGQAYSLLAAVRYAEGNTVEAKEYGEEALALAPGDPALLNIMGAIAIGENDQGAAETFFLQALEHSRNDALNANVRNNLATLYAWQKKYDQARRMYQSALERVGENNPLKKTIERSMAALDEPTSPPQGKGSD